ncbi:MAG: hypothetical protein RL556_692 [Actinomycetota bacterium]|jgi:hypothetical protein
MSRLAKSFTRGQIIALALAAHLIMIAIGFSGLGGTPMGDITLYQFWNQQLQSGAIYGITTDWVYPFVDLIFIWLPNLLTGFLDYFSAWIVFSVAIDLLAIWALIGWRGQVTESRARAALLWIAFQFALGPVGISRLDNLSVAIAVIGVASLLDQRERLAGAWFAVATWIKVWPVALLLALVSGTKKISRAVLPAAVVSIGLLLLGIWAGGFHSLSFAFAQNTRGIEFEAPVATWWVWASALKVPDTFIYFDEQIRAVQIHGALVETFASLSSIALIFALAITATLALLARKQIKGDAHKAQQVFAWVGLTATTDLIVFNRVGSPQYIAWMFLPVIFAVAAKLPNWRFAAGLLALVSALSWLIYPIIFDQIWLGNLNAVSVLTIRNLLLVLLLIHANVRLTALTKTQAE